MTFAGYGVEPVESTTHISFGCEDKTFRLYAGKTLYAFCIGPELILEHLFWGEKLPPGYDLRYLAQSGRNTHFNVTEAAPDRFSGKIVLEAETLDDIQSTWRENRVWVPKDMDDQERFQRRRLENYSWRIMSKVTMHDQKQQMLKDRRPNLRSIGSVGDMGKLVNMVPSTRNTHGQSRPRLLSSASVDTVLEEPYVPAEGRPDICYTPKTLSASPLQSVRKRLKYIPSESNLLHMKRQAELEQTECVKSKEPGRSADVSMKFRHPVLDQLPSNQKLQSRHRHVGSFDRSTGKLGKGGLCVEYADHGTGDFRTPSFLLVDNFNGSSISPLRYRRHKIFKGKLEMPDGLPGVRCVNDDEASTLVVTLADVLCGIEVDLVYVAMHNYDAITRRTVFRNTDRRRSCSSVMLSNDSTEFRCSTGSSKVILKASSMSLDIEAEANSFHLVQLTGSWARERQVVESKLVQGVTSFGSTRGVSSHEHNPFAAITVGHPNETKGEVRAFSFVYSGNFLVEAELAETGRLRFTMGLHPMGMQWHLLSGKYFATPEVVMVRSSEGLGGMSRTFHRLFLERLLPRNWSDTEPPICLNTWETKYYHVTHENVFELAKEAIEVGVNLIVVDDGWFGTRNDDTTSLGDWIANLTKFPGGLKPLVDKINALGCRFGIWVEPEMVSENSALYQAHKDWVLSVPGRTPHVGRHQIVLDMSRPDVCDHIYNAIASILSSAHIEYLKWDMNRPLTEVFSRATSSSGVWQSEISHRYMLGVYDVQRRVSTNFPHVLLENCASGGGRFDPGMLYFSPQIWCSDNTDAIVRLRIQYGTSLVYPTRTMGTHVSAVPNHLTGNSTRLRTRGFVAMSGTFGYELDLGVLGPKEVELCRQMSSMFLEVADTVRYGDMYRIWHPSKVSLAAWMFVSACKSNAVVFSFSLNTDHWSNLVPRLILQGLDPLAEYQITEPIPNNVTQSTGNVMIIETPVPVYQLGTPCIVLTGKILMTAGLPVKFYTLDDCIIFTLEKIGEKNDE